MKSANMLRYLIMTFWIVFCIMSALKGCNGQLSPLHAGTGWAMLALFSIIITYAYYKINKTIVMSTEKLKEELEKINKDNKK